MKPHSKSWRDVLPPHPAAQLLPPLPEEELRVLGEDIKAMDCIIPSASLRRRLVRGERATYSLLDGVSRLDAMELVGIDLEIDRDDCCGWAVVLREASRTA